MSLVSEISDVVTAIGTDIKQINSTIAVAEATKTNAIAVSPIQPVDPNVKLWIQTGLPNDGYTVWIIS